MPAFTRQAYVPALLRAVPVTIIAPSIDPVSSKNCAMEPEMARAILAYTGLLEGPLPDGVTPQFHREDGSVSRLSRRADVIGLGRAASSEASMVVQVSRWDPLKDHVGVMHGFARLAETGMDATLMLAGPNGHARRRP